MKPGTLNFDGVDYPDNNASDPNLMGWMQGAPPPVDKRIRFEDDRALGFPQNRWTLSHLRELVPTVNVWRGSGRANDLGSIDAALAAEIDRLSFIDMNGKTRLWADALADTYTDGIVVLHRGKRVFEFTLGPCSHICPISAFQSPKAMPPHWQPPWCTRACWMRPSAYRITCPSWPTQLTAMPHCAK